MQKLTWQLVGLIAVLAGVVVALAVLTDWGSAEIIAVVSILGGIGGGAAVAGSVAGRVDDVLNENVTQTGILDTIERHTNGELDARFEAIVRRVLREEGR